MNNKNNFTTSRANPPFKGGGGIFLNYNNYEKYKQFYNIKSQSPF